VLEIDARFAHAGILPRRRDPLRATAPGIHVRSAS
jgi:hypothetical protein